MSFGGVFIIMGLGFIFFCSLIYTSYIIAETASKFKKIKIKNEEFHKKMKEKEQFTKENHHEWIKVALGTKEVLACKHTGWCPEKNGFISMDYIEQAQRMKSLEEQLEIKKQNAILKLSEKYSLEKEAVQDILETVYEVKKQFYLDIMSDSVREMRRDEKE